MDEAEIAEARFERAFEKAQNEYAEALVQQELVRLLKEAGASPQENLMEALKRIGGAAAGYKKARERVAERLSWDPQQ
jgi:hypothetical protein